MLDSVDAISYTIKGRRYIRVTELLRARGLVDFSKIPKRMRSYYMARGTGSHKLWEDVERGIDDQYDYDPVVETYRAGHTRFLAETGFKAIPGGIEKRVHSDELRIAGTIDRLGTIQGKLVLLDYKTSKVYPSTAIQCALYLLCLPEYQFHEVKRYGVAMMKDGKYKMSKEYPLSDKDLSLWHVSEYWKEAKGE